MGRASNRKIEARVQAAIQRFYMQQSKTPFWEQNLFWGPLGLVAGILLMVLAVMKDVRWLLFIAWPMLLISLWVATRDIASLRKRIASFASIIVVCILGHLALHLWLAPESLSNEQLCSNAKSFAQRLRDFDHERVSQREEMQKQFRSRIGEAKTETEKIQLGKEAGESLSHWQTDYQYDLENKFIPEALAFRHQLLSRLPQQPEGTVINDEATFRNIGPHAIYAAANRIEVLARMLCPKMFQSNNGSQSNPYAK